MTLARHQTDLLLHDLERRIRGRSGWRGHELFYQTLEYDLRPILETAEDPEYVREWSRAMLVRNGHAPTRPQVLSRPRREALGLLPGAASG